MGLLAGFDVHALAIAKSGCPRGSLNVEGATKPISVSVETGVE